MSTYGSIERMMASQEERYKNSCVNGKCSGCGECCTDLLPLTDAELKRLKDYAKRHNLRENRHSCFWDKNATDLTCPFLNKDTSKCDVYPIRPVICREFICSKEYEQAIADRDFITSQSRTIRSLRFEVFGNSESLDLLQRIYLTLQEKGL